MRTKREDPTRIAVVSAGSRNLRSYDSSPLNLEIEFVSDDGDADSVQTGNASNPKKKRSAQKENAQNQNSPTHSQASKRARQASANSPPPSKYRAASTEPPASPRSSARTAKKTGPSSLAKEVRTKRPTAGSKRPYTPPPNTKISSRKSLSENPEDDAEGNTTLSPSKTPSKRSPASKSNVSTTKPKPSKRTSASAVNSRKRTKKSTSDVENTSLADSESTSKSLAQLKSSSSSKSIGRQAATEKPRRGGRSNPNSKNRGRRPPKKRNSESESESAPALEVCATIPIDRLASDSAASASASLQLVHMHPLYKKYPQLLLESHVDLCDRDDCSFVADLKRLESESAALIAKCPQLHWRLVIPLCTSLECQRAQSVYCTIQVQQNQNDEPVFTWDELTGLKRFLCIPLVARPLDSRLSDYQPLTALLDNDKPNAASTSTGKPLGPGLPLNQVSKYMPAAADRAEVDYVTWLSDETAAADVDTELEPQEDSAISKAGTAAARDERYRLTPVSESTEEFGTPAASTTAPDPLFSATEAAAQEEAQSADTDIELPEPGSSRSSVDELVVDWADAARQPAVDLDAVEVLEEEDIEHASPAKSAADLIPARDYSPSPLASTDADIAESPAAAAAPDGQ